MDDVIVHVISEPSFLLTALINVLPFVYLFGLLLLVCLLYKHLRQRHAAAKRKNH